VRLSTRWSIPGSRRFVVKFNQPHVVSGHKARPIHIHYPITMISHNGFIGRILVGTRHEKRGKWEKSRVENLKGDKFKRVARTLIKLLVVGDL